MVGVRDRDTAFHRNTDNSGRPLTVEEREKLLKPFLPPTPTDSRSPSPVRKPQLPKRRRRGILKPLLHLIIYTVVHAVYSVYIRARRVYHAILDHVLAILFHHFRTPEYIRSDVRDLSRLPGHLSVILDYEDDAKGGAGLEGLLNDVSELAAWCAGAGIPMLSVYEKTGEQLFDNQLPHVSNFR